MNYLHLKIKNEIKKLSNELTHLAFDDYDKFNKNINKIKVYQKLVNDESFCFKYNNLVDKMNRVNKEIEEYRCYISDYNEYKKNEYMEKIQPEDFLFEELLIIDKDVKEYNNLLINETFKIVAGVVYRENKKIRNLDNKNHFFSIQDSQKQIDLDKNLFYLEKWIPFDYFYNMHRSKTPISFNETQINFLRKILSFDNIKKIKPIEHDYELDLENLHSLYFKKYDLKISTFRF